MFVCVCDGTDEPFCSDELIRHLFPHLHVTDEWRKALCLCVCVCVCDGTDEPFCSDKLIRHLRPHLHVTDEWRKAIQCSR